MTAATCGLVPVPIMLLEGAQRLDHGAPEAQGLGRTDRTADAPVGAVNDDSNSVSMPFEDADSRRALTAYEHHIPQGNADHQCTHVHAERAPQVSAGAEAIGEGDPENSWLARIDDRLRVSIRQVIAERSSGILLIGQIPPP